MSYFCQAGLCRRCYRTASCPRSRKRRHRRAETKVQGTLNTGTAVWECHTEKRWSFLMKRVSLTDSIYLHLVVICVNLNLQLLFIYYYSKNYVCWTNGIMFENISPRQYIENKIVAAEKWWRVPECFPLKKRKRKMDDGIFVRLAFILCNATVYMAIREQLSRVGFFHPKINLRSLA